MGPPRTDVKRPLVRGSLHAACAIDRLQRREAANTRPRGVRSAATPWRWWFSPDQAPGQWPPPTAPRPAKRRSGLFSLAQKTNYCLTTKSMPIRPQPDANERHLYPRGAHYCFLEFNCLLSFSIACCRCGSSSCIGGDAGLEVGATSFINKLSDLVIWARLRPRKIPDRKMSASGCR
jgi:hypothetical protein